MSKLKERINSDRGASNSTEVILLIALSVFAVLAISNYIIKPMVSSSKNIGKEIEAMSP